MPRKKVPATAGFYTVVIEIPGSQGWVEGIHDAFDKWTLTMAQEGPSEAVEVLPAFEVIDQTGEEPALFKLTFVKCTADSAWAAVEDCAENLTVIACQRPSRIPQGRPSNLPTRGHDFSPPVAIGSPHA